MSYHPNTIIISDWFDKNRYIKNLPEPCAIVIDNIHYCSSLPIIYIQVEPRIIYNSTRYIIDNHKKYHTIFTFDDDILRTCPNAKKYVYGTTWIRPDYYMNIDVFKKEFKISTLAGSKQMNNAEGHTFRRTVHDNQHQLKQYPITFYRSSHQRPNIRDYGNNPFLISKTNNTHCKIELFDTFQYAIIIENSKQNNYFTEKIVDCLITKTIPIYWGCPNISDFFDTTGWIILETCTVEELKKKLSVLNPTYYMNYIKVINENYKKAIYYSDIYNNINNCL